MVRPVVKVFFLNTELAAAVSKVKVMVKLIQKKALKLSFSAAVVMASKEKILVKSTLERVLKLSFAVVVVQAAMMKVELISADNVMTKVVEMISVVEVDASIQMEVDCVGFWMTAMLSVGVMIANPVVDAWWKIVISAEIQRADFVLILVNLKLVKE